MWLIAALCVDGGWQEWAPSWSHPLSSMYARLLKSQEGSTFALDSVRNGQDGILVGFSRKHRFSL